MNYNHTPTTEEIRQHWTDIGFGGDGPSFDRWHQEEHRQAKADGFDEGVRASGLDLDYILQLLDNNPYRSQK